MKSISNILLIAVIIIYIFFPFFETGIWGSKTGFEFSEQTINSASSTITTILYALIPFVACFGAIALNCQKHILVRVCSCLFIGAGIFFYYDACNLDCIVTNVRITHLGVGYNISKILLWIALAVNLLSFIPFSRFLKKKKTEVAE